MTGAGCPPGHVTSDVTAAFLSHQPATRGKATSTTERQQSLAGGHYGQYGGRPEDGDVRLAGNDYFTSTVATSSARRRLHPRATTTTSSSRPW